MIEPALLFSIIGALFGGVILKVVEGLMGRRKVKEDIATTIRDELRKEITELRDRIDLQDSQIADWKTKYFTLLEQFVGVKGELNFMMRRVKEMSDEGVIDWSEFRQGIDSDDQ